MFFFLEERGKKTFEKRSLVNKFLGGCGRHRPFFDENKQFFFSKNELRRDGDRKCAWCVN